MLEEIGPEEYARRLLRPSERGEAIREREPFVWARRDELGAFVAVVRGSSIELIEGFSTLDDARAGARALAGERGIGRVVT